MNTLDENELKELLKNYNLVINGIYAKDIIPTLENGFYIINLDDDRGPGTHWTALLYKNRKGYYFDSMGLVPPQDLEDKLKTYVYNSRDIQDLTSSSCGFYIIAFIKFMTDKLLLDKAFNTFINLFSDDTLKNEIILKSLLN